MGKHGGKREGSGRKPKLDGKRRIEEYFDERDVRELVAYLKSQMTKEPKIAIVVMEQLFGKAPQRLEMTGKDGKPFIIEISKEIAEQNGLDSGTGTNRD